MTLELACDSALAALVEDTTVYANKRLTGDLWKLVLRSPRIAPLVQPGQFVHVGFDDTSRHILRRPLSVHDVFCVEGDDALHLSLLYQVVGKGTAFLTNCSRGDRLNLLGPLGNGWHLPKDARCILLVGGGVGWAPLHLHANTAQSQDAEVHALIGARTASYYTTLVLDKGDGPFCHDDKPPVIASGDSLDKPPVIASEAPEGCEAWQSTAAVRDQEASHSATVFFHPATDDGSLGHHGFNTDLLESLLATYRFDYIATCGPEPMQRIVAEKARQHGIACEVSLERRMACGLGACLSCVVETTDGKKRACIDGPVFDAREVCW